MMAIIRTAVGLAFLLSLVAGTNGIAAEKAGAPRAPIVFAGACYCRAAGTLECTGNLTERECRQRCDEAFCDDWFWKERLPCWNWGYGG
jgi:hypothetical protein